MLSIFLPFDDEYQPTGPRGRLQLASTMPAEPRVERIRLEEGQTVVILDTDGHEVERIGRDKHWCLFQGSCPQCTRNVVPCTPVQFRRPTPLAPELCVHCEVCGQVWLHAVDTTLPI